MEMSESLQSNPGVNAYADSPSLTACFWIERMIEQWDG